METCDWRSGYTVKESLQKNYHHFNIFQVMALLLSEDKSRNGKTADYEIVDKDCDINNTVRISSDTGYDFAPSEVLNLDYQPHPEQVSTMRISSFSVGGRSGPLPDPHKEYLGHGKNAMTEFLDIFNHRLNVMRFQIKRKATTGLEDTSPDNFFASVLVKNIAGFGTEHLADRWPLTSRELMLFSGLLASKRKNVSVVKAVLSYYLNTDVNIIQFEESRHIIHRDERTHIGKEKRNNSLGRTSVLGTRFYDRHNQIRIICGPLGYDLFMQLLPGGDKFRQFTDTIRFLTNNDLNCLMELVLKKKDTPISSLSHHLHLGSDTAIPFRLKSKKTMMLGRNSWIKHEETDEEEEIAVQYLIRPEEKHGSNDIRRAG